MYFLSQDLYVAPNSPRCKRQVDSTWTRTHHDARPPGSQWAQRSADRLTPQEELLKIADKRRNSCQQQVRHWNISLTNWILISQPLETDSTDLLLIANATRQVVHVRAGETYEPAVSPAVVRWRLIKVYFCADDKNWVTSNWASCLWCIAQYIVRVILYVGRSDASVVHADTRSIHYRSWLTPFASNGTSC